MIAGYLEILGAEKKLRWRHRQGTRRKSRKTSATNAARRSSKTRASSILEDLVQVEDVAVTVTRGGYLKRTPIDTYQRQTRGGKGRIGMGTRARMPSTSDRRLHAHRYLLIFTNKGRVYWLKIYEIPDAGTTGKGQEHQRACQPAAR